MGLADTKAKRLIDLILSKKFRQGAVPPASFIKAQAAQLGRSALEGPMLEVAFQKDGPFDVDIWNLAISQTRFDLDMIYEQLTAEVNNLLRGINTQQISFETLQYQLDKIDRDLENILLTTQDARGFVHGASESFFDVSRIDPTSTVSVDLVARKTTLPANQAATKKLNIQPVIDPSAVEASVQVRNDTEFTDRRTINASPADMFDDQVGEPWQYHVVTPKPDGVEIQFSFPVHLTTEIPVSRIDVSPLTSTPAKVHILLSRDNVNFTLPPRDDRVKISSSAPISWLFPQTGVQYVAVRMLLETPDSMELVDGKALHKYVFGLQNISLFTIGYDQEGLFRSLPLGPDGTVLDSISQVALTVQDQVTPGRTEITYSIAPVFDNGDIGTFDKVIPARTHSDPLLPANFIQVLHTTRSEGLFRVNEGNPANLKGIGGASKALLYRASLAFQDQTVTNLEGTKIDNTAEYPFVKEKGSRSIYVIPRTDSSSPPIPGNELPFLTKDINTITARLFRGRNSWQVQPATKQEIIRVRNNYLQFPLDETDLPLYRAIPEELVAVDVANVQVEVSRAILTGTNVAKVGVNEVTPVFSILQALHIKKSADTATVGTTGVLTVVGVGGDRKVFFEAPALTPLEDYVGRFVHIIHNNVSEYFKISDTGQPTAAEPGTGTDQFILDDPEFKLSSTSAGNLATFNVNAADLTDAAKISSITGRIVKFTGVTFETGDRVAISYNSPLLPEEQVIKSSVDAVSIINGGTRSLKRGRDFFIGAGSSRFQLAGDFPRTGDVATVRVSYQVEILRKKLTVYSAHVHVPENQGQSDLVVSLADLALDEKAGETAVFLNTPGGSVDLTSQAELTLYPGWHRVVVTSKEAVLPDGSTLNIESALYKVVNMLDLGGSVVFHEGRFFDKMTAFLEPMRPVTVTVLEKAVFQLNHQFFGLDDEGNIYLNFDPAFSTDILYLLPGSSTVMNQEDFEFEFDQQPTLTQKVKKVVLQAELRRLENTDGSETPVLEAYALRFA